MTEKMKPSGIAWIGDIPASWKTKKIKHYTKIVNGSTPDSSDFNCWDGPIKWITPADMDNTGIISEGERTLTQYGYNSCGTTLLPKGSVVISSRAPIGKINITGDVLCTNQGCKSLVSESDNRYLYYLLLAGQEELVCLGRGTTFIELSTYDLANFGIVLPQETEQCTIADFLDSQCAKIDSVIADIEKQIETLLKYKKSLITEAVTKGLDRVVPMKDSGVACIGLVPQNWTYKKLGYMAEVTKLAGFEFTDYFEYVDEGVIAVRGLNLKNFDISLADIQHIPEKTSDMLPRSQIHYNDVLISYAGTVGSVGLVTDTTKRYHLAPNVGKVTVLSELIPRYLAYYLISYAGQEHIDQLKNKNAQESISMENIRRIKVLVPSQAEQQNICDYLDEKVNEVDTIISGQQKKLELMHAHKKSLIYEYVTGKKRVTEVN